MPVPIVPLVVATALFMEHMDSAVVATALPVIARDLGVDPIALKLAVTSYLVSLAVFIPVSGWVADRYGVRTTFRAALCVFMAASLGCALSSSLEALVVWRFVQGMGAAMMTPVGRLVLIRSIPKAELVRSMAFLTVPALVGPMAGPLIGGALATYADWRWIFLVNLPIGVVGIVMAGIHFSDERSSATPLDRKGFALAAIGLSGLVLGAATLGRHVAPGWVTVASIVIGLGGAAAYVRHARSAPHPLIDLALLRDPAFDAGVAGGALFRIGIGASAFLMPLLLQIGFGYDAMTSGLVTFAGAVGAMAMKPLAAAILRRVGFRRVLIANGLAASALVAVPALFTSATPLLAMWVILLVAGLSRSLQFTSLNALSYADVSPAQSSRATSLASVAQQISLGFGVALGAVLLEVASALAGRGTLAAEDFQIALVVVAAVSALSVARILPLPADAGRGGSGHGAEADEP
jgi:EmrB/QacA subfamily drug resistance transporter